jgi:hypothetical protein
MFFDGIEKNLITEDIDFLRNNQATILGKRGKSFGLSNFFENSKFITAKMFFGKGRSKIVVYDKNTKKHIGYERVKGKYWDDFAPESILGTYNEYFFGLIYPASFIWISDYINKHNLSKEIDTKLKKIVNESEISDNPSIILYNFKDIIN